MNTHALLHLDRIHTARLDLDFALDIAQALHELNQQHTTPPAALDAAALLVDQRARTLAQLTTARIEARAALDQLPAAQALHAINAI